MNSHRQFTLCTLCLGFEKELLYAFDCNASDITLPVVIRELLQFEVSEDGYIPWMICTNCVEKLKDFSEFKKQANKSMDFLQIMLVGRRENRNKTLGDGLPTCMAMEQDVIDQAPPEEEDLSIRDGNCSNGGGYCSDVHTSESVMHVKREDVEKEVPPAEQYLTTSSEKSSFGEVQCSDVYGSASEEPIKMELSELIEKVLPGSSQNSMMDEHLQPCDIESQQEPIKMELSELTEMVSPGSCQNSMTDEHLQPCDVESQMCMTNERDAFEAPPPEEAASIRDAHCSSGEVHRSDIHGGESVMHVKNENEQEIPPAEECLSTSGEISSFEGAQCSDAHVSTSEQVPLSEELMGQDDLHLYLSSDSSEETSDAEDCSANITGPETEVRNVTNLTFGDVIRETVFGVGESVGNREETGERGKDLKGLKDAECPFSARLRHGAKVPVDTRSHLKQRRLRSNSRNENYGQHEDIESTPQRTSGKLIGEENGEHTERKEETRRESKHSNGALLRNISIGSSVGHEDLEGQDFICDECGKVFRSKDLIERHVKVPCGRELKDCGSSNKKFHTEKQYERHRSFHCVSNVSRRRVHRGVAVDEIRESEGKRQINKRNPPTCHVCKKTFSQKGYLKVHIKTVHMKERIFSCGICGKAFCLKQHLQSHMRYHSGVKPYTCSHCEKGFTQSGDLRKHILVVHEMEKPHTCGECGKAFSHKHHLKTHILLHTGEKPHTCGICSKTFSQKQNLERHMLIHTGEKPHTCTLCSRTFRHNHSLKRHMASHTRNVPHRCNLCSKTFAFSSELQRHLAEHRGKEND